MLGVQYTFVAAIDASNASIATLLQFLGPIYIILFVSWKSKMFPPKYQVVGIIGTLIGLFYLLTNAEVNNLLISVENLQDNTVMTKGYLGGSEQLYMSKENLYLTSTIFESTNSNSKKFIWNPGKMDTEVFKFEIHIMILKNTLVEQFFVVLLPYCLHHYLHALYEYPY